MGDVYKEYFKSIERINQLYTESIKNVERMNELYKDLIKTNERMNELYKDIQKINLGWVDLFWRPWLTKEEEKKNDMEEKEKKDE
jgi:hypothetical protein